MEEAFYLFKTINQQLKEDTGGGSKLQTRLKGAFVHRSAVHHLCTGCERRGSKKWVGLS